MASMGWMYLLNHPAVFFFEVLAITGIMVAFTPRSSIFRYGALPVMIYHQFIVPPLSREYLYFTVFAGLIGSSPLGFIMSYIDLVIINGWSYETHATQVLNGQATSSSDRTASKAQNGSLQAGKSNASTRTVEDTTWNRIRFGTYAATTCRLIGTPCQVKNVPSFKASDPSYVPSKRNFLLWRSFVLVISYLIMDGLQLVDNSDNYRLFAPEKVSVFRRDHPFNAEDVATRIASTIMWWAIAFTMFNFLHSLCAIPAILLGLSKVNDWPPFFGPLGDCWSVRQFWGCFWHQLLRHRFSTIAEFTTFKILQIPRGTLVARYTNLTFVYALSGILHLGTDVAQGLQWRDSGAMQFFLTQVLGIMIEDAVQALYRRVSGTKRNEGERPPLWARLGRPVIMSKIHKLQILGVRSFDNAHSETIAFNTPLTLIVGYNGSGKTTIIECLKYATTGEQPANTRGGAFIHDPKLCGEREVLAQVKLSFDSTGGARMVVTRSLQLTVKKLTRSMKTLEGNLMMVKNGERASISSRVAELDTIMPQYLGVSKAVLENVIFCHQEDSAWPMSEPGALKKKFDDIFEAVKYTKAIDNIKALRKKHNEDFGNYKLMEQHAKENKDKADKAEKKSIELSNEIDILRTETKDLGRKAKDAGDKMQEAWNQVAHYTETVESLKVSRRQLEWTEKEVNHLSQHLEVRDESDEQLQTELNQFEQRMETYTQRQDEQAERYNAFKKTIEDIRARRGIVQGNLGKHEHRKQIYEQNLGKREEEIKVSARRHGLRGYEDSLDDMQINEFMDRIARLSKDHSTKVDRLKRENASEIDKIQEVLSGLREQRSACEESRKVARSRIASNDHNLASSHKQLGEVAIDEGGKANLEAEARDTEAKLRKAKEDLRNAGTESRIQEAKAELHRVEEEEEKLQSEILAATQHAGMLGRLEHLQDELGKRKRSFETTKGAYVDRLRSITGRPWNDAHFESDFQKALEERKSQVSEAEKQRDGTAKELDLVETNLKNSRKDLAAKREELQKAVKKIRKSIDDGEPEDYSEIVAEYQSDRDIRKSDVDNFLNMKKYFADCVETARKQQCCRLCKRDFDEEARLEEFVASLKQRMSVAALKTAQTELREFEARLAIARDASSQYEIWMRLNETEIPKLDSKIKELDRSRDALISHIESHDALVSEREEARRDAESLVKPVNDLVRFNSDAKDSKQQIDEIKAEQQEVGLTKSLDELQQQENVVKNKARDLRTQISGLQADESRSRIYISSLEVELGNVKGQVMNATHDLEKKAAIIRQIEELKQSNLEQRQTLKDLNEKYEELFKQLTETDIKKADLSQRWDTKEKELQQTDQALSNSIRNITHADDAINAYAESGGSEKLTQCLRDIEQCDQEISQTEEKQREIAVEINSIKDQLRDQMQTKNVIIQNLDFRRKKKEMIDVKNEIDELEAKNAEADQEMHRRHAEKWQRQQRIYNTEETSKMGTMKAKDDQLMQLLQDWNTDYKDAAERYKEAHIKVATTKAAVEDLGRYGSALDKAIMKFHSLKMEQINHIVEELWKKTYRGTDVDTILIRSDSETAKANRSYNYRVCMVKQDVEMDMRGRCSAGQKVLASIIIRLALAECFGVNCGLIALDEPTTNLDRDNIESLARSLHDIIMYRRSQKNFQLIVITHDEEFLRFMKCQDFCDTYYRVSRNDRQKSIIERQNIAGVL
ncbi:DNA repair protein rad50 [Agyrium rufum]|nr:DNA repair protein rad50 [Agyrium rufum]